VCVLSSDYNSTEACDGDKKYCEFLTILLHPPDQTQGDYSVLSLLVSRSKFWGAIFAWRQLQWVAEEVEKAVLRFHSENLGHLLNESWLKEILVCRGD